MSEAYTRTQLVGLLLGPLSFLFLLWLEVPGLAPEGRAALAAAAWVALWWTTDAIPMAATGLLPLVLFPLCGVLPMKAATAAFANPLVFLFLGGFLLAVAIERVRLHERIALHIIAAIGQDWRSLLLGFMAATALLSMWISNTATAVMMLPIGTAVYSQLAGSEAERLRRGRSLMLAIAYGCSTGGIATLIGTPTNVVLSGMVDELYGIELGFAQWLTFGLPLALLLLGVAWVYLTFVAFPVAEPGLPGGRAAVRARLAALGPMRGPERRVLAVFLLVALAWISRPFLLQPYLPALNDTGIALIGALLLFTLPADRNDRLLDWPTAATIPWGILLLFGGGLTLAAGFSSSGLADWIGAQLAGLAVLPTFLLLLGLIAAVNFLTEITSNVATAAMLLPVLAALSATLGLHPFLLMVAATVAASCAFMLPVATPPNAVVFGSGLLTIPIMLRVGFWLNVLSILLTAAFVYFWLPWVWGIE